MRYDIGNATSAMLMPIYEAFVLQQFGKLFLTTLLIVIIVKSGLCPKKKSVCRHVYSREQNRLPVLHFDLFSPHGSSNKGIPILS